MPIIIQNTEVQVLPEDGGAPGGGAGGGAGAAGGAEERSPQVVPLRPADVARVGRFLAARSARVRAD